MSDINKNKILFLVTNEETESDITLPAKLQHFKDLGYEAEILIIPNELKNAWIIVSPELEKSRLAIITKQLRAIPDHRIYTNWKNFLAREFF